MGIACFHEQGSALNKSTASPQTQWDNYILQWKRGVQSWYEALKDNWNSADATSFALKHILKNWPTRVLEAATGTENFYPFLLSAAAKECINSK